MKTGTCYCNEKALCSTVMPIMFAVHKAAMLPLSRKKLFGTYWCSVHFAGNEQLFSFQLNKTSLVQPKLLEISTMKTALLRSDAARTSWGQLILSASFPPILYTNTNTATLTLTTSHHLGSGQQ
jgi:hypothetical protein